MFRLAARSAISLHVTLTKSSQAFKSVLEKGYYRLAVILESTILPLTATLEAVKRKTGVMKATIHEQNVILLRSFLISFIKQAPRGDTRWWDSV